jgi:GxxExxY protein
MHVARPALKHSALTDKVIGVFYSVYNELGPGFLESVYQRSMAIALAEIGLAAEIEAPVPVWFRGQQVGDFKADMVVERLVLLELKTAKAIDPSHEGQILHYLRATELEVGLLLNFGPQPQFKRFILENNNKKIRGNQCDPR